ncbi:MAG TPA: DUF5906 domain-containing protein [Allocoleopsis sp.]
MPNKQSVFKSIEKLSKKTIGLICQNWDEFRRRVFELTKREDALSQWDDINGNHYDPRVILQQYYANHSRQGVTVHYVHSQYTNSGRKFALKACGLQSFSRPIRHTLANGIYKDVDIENCHPVILVQYCKKKGYACDKIEKYVNNRNTYLEDIVKVNDLEWNQNNKEWAKKIILSAVNGSMNKIPKCIREMKVKPQWFEDFYNQANMIKKSVYENPENSKTVSIIKRKLKQHNKLNNIEGSVLNQILCEIEDQILMKAIEYCESNGGDIKHYVLCFDGFMIPVDEDLDLVKLSAYVKEQTDYEVRFTFKEMNEVIDLSGLNYTEINSNEEIIVSDDSQASLILIEKLKDSIRVSPNDIYIKDGVRWINDPDRVEIFLKINCMKLNFCRVSSNGDILPYSKNKKGCDNVVSTAIIHLKGNPDPDFEEKMFRSVIHKTCFPNGVYDWKTTKFTSWDENPNVYTSIIMPFNYVPKNDTLITNLKTKIFKTIFEGHEAECNDLLCALASTASGNPNDKYSIIGLGHRSSGKGVITDLLLYCFGDYVGAFDSGVFHLEGMEELRRMSFLLERKNARFLISNEAKSANNNKKETLYDGNLLKKIQGGDKLEARRIYKAPEQFRLQGKVILFCNDMPKFDPADCLQVVDMFSFPYKFVPESQLTDENKLAFYRKADPSIKDYIRQPDICMAFFHLLTEHYKTNRVISKETKAVNDSMLEDCGDEETVFKNTFKHSKDENDYIPSSEVLSWAKNMKLNMSAIKIKKMMTDMGFTYANGKMIDGVRFTGYLNVKATFNEKINEES